MHRRDRRELFFPRGLRAYQDASGNDLSDWISGRTVDRAVILCAAEECGGVLLHRTTSRFANFSSAGRPASPDRGFVKSRAHDRFSPGAEPRRTSPRLMVRLPSKLRGRFETTKNPVVRCGTLVLGRPGDGIFTYSAGRRLESENNPGKDQTGNRCTLVFAWLKTRNRQNECTTQCVHGRGPACVIAWKMVLRNTGV